MIKKDTNLMNGKGEWDESEHPRDSDGKFTSKGGQSTTSQEKTKSQSTKKELKNLNSQVKAVLEGTYKDSHITLSKETPKVLQDIGLSNYPMLITAKHTYLTIKEDDGKYTGEDDHYHNLGEDLFVKIPELLEHPTLVFQNKDKNGKLKKNNIVVVVDAVDKKNNPVIVPIKVNGKGNENYIEIDSNVILSAYGRKNFQDYIARNVNKSNLLFKDNKKIRNLNP